MPSGTDFWNFTSSEGDVKPVLDSDVPARRSAGSRKHAERLDQRSAVERSANGERRQDHLHRYLEPGRDAGRHGQLQTADGTAKASSDYVATNGTLTFHAGETSKTFDVQLTKTRPPRGSKLSSPRLPVPPAPPWRPPPPTRTSPTTMSSSPPARLNASVAHVYDLSDGSVYKDEAAEPTGSATLPASPISRPSTSCSSRTRGMMNCRTTAPSTCSR